MPVDWVPADEARVELALLRNFGEFPHLAWMWPADGTRKWAGTKKGIHVGDTRVHVKNNAEYKGLEVHAWQYLVTLQYQLAADYFYVAAVWRRADSEAIGQVDEGHTIAEQLMLRCARYAVALENRGSQWPNPTEFGLVPGFMAERERKAQRLLDEAFGST